MATIYTPRPRTPVRAFQLTEDLLASLQVGRAGDWVTLDEHDVPVHLTNNELHAVYQAPPTIDVAEVVATIAPRQEPVRRRGEGNVLFGQPGRIFHILRMLGDSAKTAEMYPWVRYPFMLRSDRLTVISACLCHLRNAGYVISEKGDFHGNQWIATQAGIDAFNIIGPRCFTEHGLQIPSLGPSPAERLHDAWQDRHAA